MNFFQTVLQSIENPDHAGSPQDLLKKQIVEKPSTPQIYNPDVTDQFADLVLRMLAKKREDRPKDFHEVLMAMRTMQVFKSAATAATQSLSYNDFLTLLMAEMKNQDPTQPMDPSQMVSQLATVSEVGQAVQTNTNLASLLTATSLSQAEQLIGRTVTSPDGSTSGQVASVSVTGSGAVATLTSGATVSLANGASVQ